MHIHPYFIHAAALQDKTFEAAKICNWKDGKQRNETQRWRYHLIFPKNEKKKGKKKTAQPVDGLQNYIGCWVYDYQLLQVANGANPVLHMTLRSKQDGPLDDTSTSPAGGSATAAAGTSQSGASAVAATAGTAGASASHGAGTSAAHGAGTSAAHAIGTLTAHAAGGAGLVVDGDAALVAAWRAYLQDAVPSPGAAEGIAFLNRNPPPHELWQYLAELAAHRQAAQLPRRLDRFTEHMSIVLPPADEGTSLYPRVGAKEIVHNVVLPAQAADPSAPLDGRPQYLREQ